MPQTYTYSVASDFPGGAINPGKLVDEIQKALLATALDYVAGPVVVNGDVCDVIFVAALSAGDKTAFDGDTTGPAGGLIAAHDNTASPGPEVVELSTKHTDAEGILNAKPKASGLDYILCDRDIKIHTGTMENLADVVEDLRYDPSDHSRSPWEEVSLVGVFKEDVGGPTGALVTCTDNTDAAANAICTVVDYIARDQNSGNTPKDAITYELRGGALWVSSGIVNPWEHQIYAVAAPNIPSASGGRMTFFDGYLQASTGQVVEALSTDAFRLDPSGPAGVEASRVRVAVFYPKATAIDHVLRLVTYRKPGTF